MEKRFAGYRVAAYDHGIYESQPFFNIADAMEHAYSLNVSRFSVIRLTKNVWTEEERKNVTPMGLQFLLASGNMDKIYKNHVHGRIICRVYRD